MKNIFQGKKNIVIPVLVFIVGIILATTMAQTTINNREAESRRLAETNARLYAGYLATDIDRGLAITNAIEQAVIATNGNMKNFSAIAANMKQDYIQSIQIAPAGVVTEIYPAEGNEAGLGDLIHRDDLRGITCRYARDNDVIIMQGPFNLFQGGSGIAIRNPVFLDKDGKREFWGFTIVIIRVPEIFGSTVGGLEDFGYAYRLSKSVSPTDPSMVEVYSSNEALSEDAVGFDFQVGDTDWRLETAPVAGWYNRGQVIRTAVLNILLYLLLAVAIYLVLTYRERKAEQQRKMLEGSMHRLEEKERLSRQAKMYAAAMGVEYPLAIELDYLQNHYRMIEYENFLNKTADREGTIDELIRIGAVTIPDKDQAEDFSALFGRGAAIRAFRSGQRELILRHMQNGDDGKIHWVETRVICTECTENIIHGICMSKSIDNEMRREQLRIEAEKASRAKSTFLMRMSHDIRTPLNGILGMIEMAERYEDSKAKQKECRDKAKEAGLVLLELVNEVLDMSKLESGEVVLEHIAFDLTEVSQSVYTVLNRQAQSRGIEIIQENCHVAHKHLIGSPVHLKRIITNIVMNAIKYNKENGKIYITCRDMPYGEHKVKLQFKCRDTGVGMTDDFMEHIFEPFTQENATARSKFGGTGLGMSIASSLTKKMGGTITVESQKDIGSTFDVIIPFDIDYSNTTKAKKTEAPELASISLKGYKILIAEDNELNMEIARFMLEEHGAQIVETVNGQEAVDAFSKSSLYELDAVLMDVMMPVMDGHEATRKIRQMQRPDAEKVPIIAMTANAFAEDRVAAKAAGMNEHLAKPLEAGLMLKTIAKCVKSYRASRNK